MLVVSDTGPLNYLVLVDAAGILPGLFGRVVAPAAVIAELRHPSTPVAVSGWAAAPPDWLNIAPDPLAGDLTPQVARLGAGERAAITLAMRDGAGLLLTDDRDAVREARRAGLAAVGTLGLVDLAARRGLIDLAPVFARLQATNFRYPPALMDALLRGRASGPGSG